MLQNMRLVDGILLSLSVVAATPAFEECLANNCQFVFGDDGSMKPQENTVCEAHLRHGVRQGDRWICFRVISTKGEEEFFWEPHIGDKRKKGLVVSP